MRQVSTAARPNFIPADMPRASAAASAAGAPAPAGAWNQVGLPILISGASVSCATACTNPLDVLKVRLQVLDPAGPSGASLAGSGAASAATRAAPRGMGEAFSQLMRHEGPLALWKGITPSLARAMCYGGLRLGLYQPIADAIDSLRGTGSRLGPRPASGSDADARQPSTPRVHRPGGAWQATKKDKEATDDASATAHKPDTTTKVAAGLASGAFAAALLNPTELVKTRMMADATARGRAGTSLGAPFTSRGPIAIVLSIVRAEGLRGLWKGAGMSMTRSATLTASQCATYDEVKGFWMRATGAEDGLGTHLCASMLTGLVTTTVTNPVDMIKTQLYVERGPNCGGDNAGAGGALRRVLAREGLAGLMRGWSANYLRLGPQTVITFVALEKFRGLAGMEAL